MTKILEGRAKESGQRIWKEALKLHLSQDDLNSFSLPPFSERWLLTMTSRQLRNPNAHCIYDTC